MRGLFVLAAVALVLVFVWPFLRGLGRGLPPAGGTQRHELVKDPVCQTYVVLSRAVTRQVDGTTLYFCSAECAEQHARRERQA